MTVPDCTTLRLDRPREGVVVLVLDRPDRYNAMTETMFDDLEAVCVALDREVGLRAVVLTGAGKAFCAGYDLADAEKLTSLGALGMLDLQEKAARAMAAVRAIGVPVIAAVNGPAAGGGLALALAADIRYAGPAATFTPSFVTIGLSAGDLGVSWLLPRLIGPAAAAEFCYTARRIGAEEAERVRLVNRLVPDPVATALETAEAVCGNSPGGIRMSKKALHANMEVTSYTAAMELENRGQALLTRTDDMAEALDAARSRRAPRFTGR